MSVILFSKNEVYRIMANSYETLAGVYNRHFFISDPLVKRDNFYRALRRIYFANVACFLCQYHDDTPEKNLDSFIDSFQELEGKLESISLAEAVNNFLQAWSSLNYNLVTNDGEKFIAKDSYELLNEYALNLGRLLAEFQARDGKEDN